MIHAIDVVLRPLKALMAGKSDLSEVVQRVLQLVSYHVTFVRREGHCCAAAEEKKKCLLKTLSMHVVNCEAKKEKGRDSVEQILQK